MRTVYLLATLDTKGTEAAYVRDRLETLGVPTTVVDTGCTGEPHFQPQVSREQVFQAAGTSLAALRAGGDRGAAVTAAAEGVARIIAQAHAEEKLAGVIGIGGSAGSTIGTAAMRALPLGVPKVMVSTLASGQVRQYVGDKDIFMLNSVVDIAGVNRISRTVLDQAARALSGLVNNPADADHSGADRPLIAATMFGVTTPCVEHARQILEQAGYEVVVFHATGVGGQAMESLIREGVFAGVLDITTTELADELVGGVLSAGPTRLTAAGQLGIPQVVSVGAADMVNFHAPETIPRQFAGRTLYKHNASVTLMRTTPEECAAIGREIGHKLAAARGPVCVYLPRAGVSAIDRAGQPFDDPAARQQLFTELKSAAGGTEVHELDHHLNDPAFAEACARRLIAMLAEKTTK